MKLGDLSIQFRALTDRLKKSTMPILQHHVIIAVLIVAGVLIYAVTVVNQVLDAPTDADYLSEKTKESIQTRFDQDTINRIDQLRDRQQNTNLRLPGGRISPFIE